MHTKKLALIILILSCNSVSLQAVAQTRARRGVRSTTGVQTARVQLTSQGYEPAVLKLRVGVPARITFTRRVSTTCATEVVLPDYGIRRTLPLDELVVVEFTPEKSGEFTFSCGMGMLRGSLIVK
jgi:plastocyanin domain-containing protein